MADSNPLLDLGRILAGYGANSAAGRVQEAGINQNQARTAADIYRAQLASALGGPALSAKQTALGDTLANIQPFQFTGRTHMVGNIPVPEATGGLGPQNFGPNTRAAGKALSDRSLARVSSPAFALPSPPQLAPLPTPGLGEKIASGVGLGSSILGALSGSGGKFSFGDGRSLTDYLLGRNGTFGTPGDVTGNYDPNAFLGIDPNTGYADVSAAEGGDPFASLSDADLMALLGNGGGDSQSGYDFEF